jgi:antitoxin (DNA-binding transcriptional repressor) of toxin-antitoxin stability system
MIYVSTTELRERISEYIAMVERGEEIIIERHNKPVAQIVKPQLEPKVESPIMQQLRAILEQPQTAPQDSLYGSAHSSSHVSAIEQARDDWDAS